MLKIRITYANEKELEEALKKRMAKTNYTVLEHLILSRKRPKMFQSGVQLKN